MGRVFLVMFMTAGWLMPTAVAVDDLDVLESRQQQLQDARKRVSPAVVSVSDGYGFGTGVVVNSDGIVLTASHVVESPRQFHRRSNRRLKVVFPDGKKANCELLGRNRYCDAAMLRITDAPPKGGFPHVRMGRSSRLRRGDWCFALGHPGGRRDDRPAVLRYGRIQSVSDQTIVSDNAIVLGDSGGPLFDLQGHLIGIHSMITRIIVENRHVAVDVWHRDWERLRRGESWGRLRIDDATLASTPFVGMRLAWNDYRASVKQVFAESPAERAGLRTGDELLRVNGRTYADRLGFSSLLARLDEDQEVPITVLRHGRETTLRLTTGQFPNEDDDKSEAVVDQETREQQAQEDAQFQQQLSFRRAIGPNEKRAPRVMRTYRDLTFRTRGSVVRFRAAGRQVCLGVVMSRDGDILTKASEIVRAESPLCVLPDGSVHEFQRIGVDSTWDLMLVRVQARGLKPIRWARERPETGQLLVSPDTQGRPMLPGIVSLPTVRLKTSKQGFLGVLLRSTNRGSGVMVKSLLEGGAAQRDGIRSGDVLLSIDEQQVHSTDDTIQKIKHCRPNQTVQIRVLRGDVIRRLAVTLTPRFVSDYNDALLSHYRTAGNSGRFASIHNSGFPEVIQHDSDLFPHQCGGPLQDLNGDATGLNIARAARVISYAIPADVVQRIYRNLNSNGLASR